MNIDTSKEKVVRFSLAFIIGVALVTGVLLALPGPEADAAPLYVGGTRASLTVTTIVPTGTTRSLSNVDGDGQKFENTGQEFLVVTNDLSDSAIITITILTTADIDGFSIEDQAIQVAAGVTRYFGPFSEKIFSRKSGTDRGKIYIDWTWDGTSTLTGAQALSVSVGAYKLD